MKITKTFLGCVAVLACVLGFYFGDMMYKWVKQSWSVKEPPQIGSSVQAYSTTILPEGYVIEKNKVTGLYRVYKRGVKQMEWPYSIYFAQTYKTYNDAVAEVKHIHEREIEQENDRIKDKAHNNPENWEVVK